MRNILLDPSINHQNLRIGIDECGIGPIAGPMVFCGVLADKTSKQSCKDSKVYKSSLKMLTDVVHSELYRKALVEIWPEQHQQMGHDQSMGFAYRLIIEALRKTCMGSLVPVMIDGHHAHRNMPRQVQWEPRADSIYPVVSLASCYGKLRQVYIMDALNKLFPQYAFNKHHGYGTPRHTDAIALHGAIPLVHRMKQCAKALRGRPMKVFPITDEQRAKVLDISSWSKRTFSRTTYRLY
jgi:ribonuclease HII